MKHGGEKCQQTVTTDEAFTMGGREKKYDGTSLKEGKSKHVSRELVGLEFRMIQRYLLMESTLYSNSQRVSEGNCFSQRKQKTNTPLIKILGNCIPKKALQ